MTTTGLSAETRQAIRTRLSNIVTGTSATPGRHPVCHDFTTDAGTVWVVEDRDAVLTVAVDLAAETQTTRLVDVSDDVATVAHQLATLVTTALDMDTPVGPAEFVWNATRENYQLALHLVSHDRV
jgi:hypothetical protein